MGIKTYRLNARRSSSWPAWTLIGSLLTASAGCSGAGTLSDAGARVKMGGQAPSAKCRDLGIVYGSGGGGLWTGSESKLQGAQNRLREAAAKKGANFVVMNVANGDQNSTSISGNALLCKGLSSESTVPHSSSATRDGNGDESIERRLLKLDSLLKKGLISRTEHDQRRQEILRSL